MAVTEEHERFDAVVGASRGSGQSLLADEIPGKVARKELKALTARWPQLDDTCAALNAHQGVTAPLLTELRTALVEHLTDRALTKLTPAINDAYAELWLTGNDYPHILVVDGELHYWPDAYGMPNWECAAYELAHDYITLRCGRELPADEVTRGGNEREWQQPGRLVHCAGCADRLEEYTTSHLRDLDALRWNPKTAETVTDKLKNQLRNRLSGGENPLTPSNLQQFADTEARDIVVDKLGELIQQGTYDDAKHRMAHLHGLPRYLRLRDFCRERAGKDPHEVLNRRDWQKLMGLFFDGAVTRDELSDWAEDRTRRRLTRRKLHISKDGSDGE